MNVSETRHLDGKSSDISTFNVKFVNIIKNYPVLYDVNHDSYQSREAVQIAWNSVSEEIKEEPEECKRRWRHIRQAYSRYTKKAIEGSELAILKPYYLAKHMDFVANYMTHRDKTTNRIKFDFDPNTTSNTDSCQNSISVKSEQFDEYNDEEVEPTHHAKNLKRKHAEELKYIENCEKSATPKLITVPHQDRIFLESILPDMSMMNPRQKLIFKSKLMALIAETLYPIETAGPSNMSNN